MTWEIPWITSGIEELPVSTARVLAYAATEGNSGVIAGNDLKVTAKSPATAQIEVAPGVLVANTRYTGSSYESYVGRNLGTDTISIPTVGGSSRYDFVYAHVTDPGQVGQPGSVAPVETRVVTGVSSTATTMADVAALDGETGVPLARIFRTAGASIVNPGDITDIRSFLSSGLVSEIKMWPTNTAPSGWLVCNGAAVSRTTYSALFAVIGTIFGSGDGATTFNLPNMQDRFPIGVSGTKTIGTTGGSATVALPNHTHNVPAHSHTISSVTHEGSSNAVGGGSQNRVGQINGTVDGTHNHGGATGTQGIFATSDPTSNPNLAIQNPYLALTFIIRAI